MKNKFKVDIKKIFNIIKEFIIKNRVFLLILGILLLLIIFTIIIVNIIKNNNVGNIKTTNYDIVKKIIDDKEDAIIYYYNSKSGNKNNKEIKKYLDSERIRYYLYDDIDVDNKEYENLLKLLNIDKDLFRLPAIIYIKDGMMYGNIINIDKREIVKQFLDDYDLYTVK